MNARCVITFVASCLVVATAGVAPRAAGSVTLGLPGQLNAYPSIATWRNLVALTWAAFGDNGQTDIYVSTSRDRGATFTSPQRVNDTPGDAHASRDQQPRIAIVVWPGGVHELHVVWLAARGDNTVLLTTGTSDLGSRRFGGSRFPVFLRPWAVKGADGVGNRLWPSIAADSGHFMHVAWRSDRGPSQRDAQLIAGTIDATEPVIVASAACNPALAAGASHELYLAWHQLLNTGGLAVVFRVSRDQGVSFGPMLRVSEDTETGDACPEDGPALAVDQRGRIHVVWAAAVNDNGERRVALFHAISADGQLFSRPTRLPTDGQAHRPDVTVAAGSLYVAWEESIDGSQRIGLARGIVGSDGQVSFNRLLPGGDRRGSSPALAASDKGVLLAWTTAAGRAQSVIRVDAIR